MRNIIAVFQSGAGEFFGVLLQCFFAFLCFLALYSLCINANIPQHLAEGLWISGLGLVGSITMLALAAVYLKHNARVN